MLDKEELSLPLIFRSGVLERTQHLSGDFFPKPTTSTGLERAYLQPLPLQKVGTPVGSSTSLTVPG